MRIIHVMEAFSAEGGGLPSAVSESVRRQAARGWQVSLLQTHSRPRPSPEGVAVYTCSPSDLGRRWLWSPKLKPILQQLLSVGDQTIVHIHGVWTAPQLYAAKCSRANGIPYVISPHGQMLEGVVATRGALSYVKKNMYRKWVAGKFMREASVLHAITGREAEVLHSLFPQTRVEVIPNGIDTQRAGQEIDAVIGPAEAGRKTILFLGRLDPRKGIETLIHAFKKARLTSDWHLLVVGPDDVPGYRRYLSRLVERLDCADSVSILGPVYGSDKWGLYKQSNIFCLPSRSEVIGLVNLEAAMCAVPVITTPQTGLDDWEVNGGVMVEPEVTTLSNSLRQAASWSDSERVDRGKKLQTWVCNRYNLDKIDQSWVELYESVIR